jgi:Glycosyl hydrolase family 71
VTWNDFSESSAVAPVTDSTLQRNIGTGYYNLTGFFASWFLTGQQPQITHDVLYYFYRRETTTAAATAQGQKDNIATGTAENNIELLAFLTSPGVLKVAVGGKTYTQNAAAGMVSFTVPSQAGTPVFTLSRNGADVFSLKGGVAIYGTGGLPSGFQDLTFWSGSASKSGTCSL